MQVYSDTVRENRKPRGGGALLTESSARVERMGSAGSDSARSAIDKVLNRKTRSFRAATLIEYSLITACISLCIAVAGPPVAEAVQGQFTKVADVISNGSTGDTGGGSDFPGGGNGGGSNQDKTDTDDDGIPDAQDPYPNDPNNGNGGDTGGDGSGDGGQDQKPGVKEQLAGTVALGDCVVGLTSAPVPDGAVQSDASLSYAWYVNGAKVSSDPYYTFIPVQNNAKAYVTASDASGTYTGQLKSETVTVTARGLSEIMGVALPDPVEDAQCDAVVSGAPRGAQLSYTWKLDGAKVGNAASYTPAKGDAGKNLEVTVRDTAGTYAGEVSATKTIGAAQLPKLNGYINLSDCTVGLTSSAVAAGIQSDAQLELTWYVDGKASGTGSTHEFTAADRDKNVYVTAEDKGGNYQGTITSPVVRVSARTLTGSVAFGEPAVGAALTASVSGAPSDMVPAYSWKLDGAEVATGRTYTPKAEDAGKVLYVEITDSSNMYTGRISSTAATVEAAGGSDAESGKLTGSIQIGSCTVGLSSSVFASGAPADAQLAYEWQVGGNKVADTESYTFTTADKDKEVRVLATDKGGKYEGTLYSNVVRVNVRQITGSVTFGEPVANAKLTANVSGVPSDVAGSLSYAWKLDGAQVSTSSTYTPDANAVGKVLFVEVSDSSGKYSGTVCSTAETVKAKSSSDVGGGSQNNVEEEVIATFNGTYSYRDTDDVKAFSSVSSSANITKSGANLIVNNAGTYRITPTYIYLYGFDHDGFVLDLALSAGSLKVPLCNLKARKQTVGVSTTAAEDHYLSTSHHPVTLSLNKNDKITVALDRLFNDRTVMSTAESTVTFKIEKVG